MNTTKQCKDCKQIKLRSEFYYRVKKGYDSICKNCKRIRLDAIVETREARLLRSYKRHDKEAGRECTLTKDEVKDIITLSCVYCGVSNNIGLDRIDNKLGHIQGNVVPCCHKCNTMKKLFTREDFIAQCLAVARFAQSGIT